MPRSSRGPWERGRGPKRAPSQLSPATLLALRKRQIEATEAGDRIGLLDSIPKISPGWLRPDHLEDYAAALEAAVLGAGSVEFEGAQIIGTMPPRFGKTELILHTIAWALRRRPELKIGYATYGASLAEEKSARARTLAQRIGVDTSGDLDRVGKWMTPEGGGLHAAGVGGGWTGHGFDLLFVDDPIKDRQEAESPTTRARVWDFWNDVASTRLEPGATAVLNMTRWHTDDLAGRLLKEGGWDLHRHAAILHEDTDHEASLWPERWALRELVKRRARLPAYTWDSLYRNNPKPKGGTLFDVATWTEDLPKSGYRIGRGVDLAYSLKSKGDHSVYVEMLKVDPGRAYAKALHEIGIDAAPEAERLPLYFVSDVVIMRAPAEVFSAQIADRVNEGPKPLLRYGGQEAGYARLMENTGGLRLVAQPTKGNKWTNALGMSADWNAGRIMLPRGRDWTFEVEEQMISFTGVEGEPDDIVDAMVSAYEQLQTPHDDAPRGLADIVGAMVLEGD